MSIVNLGYGPFLMICNQIWLTILVFLYRCRLFFYYIFIYFPGGFKKRRSVKIQPISFFLFSAFQESFHKEVSRADACCFCYDNGAVSVCLDLPRRGFVPGEYIPVTAEIKNTTSNSVRTSVHFIKVR